MSVQGPTPQGRRRLLALLPSARAEAAKTDEGRVEVGVLGSAQLAYLKEENFVSIEIYPAPLGGWHCDVLLANVPVGVPNVMGTPVQSPLATRDAAEAHSRTLLVTVLKLMQLPKPEKAEPYFLLYGVGLPLSQKAVEMCSQISHDAVELVIREALAEVCPEDAEHWDAHWEHWSAAGRLELLRAVHMAAASGVFTYPLRKDGRPAEQSNQGNP
jgi:hypothetical protein